jgi:hypothetical protein
VLIAIGRRETPESVLAFCRERRIAVVASCVVSRTVHPPTPPVAGGTVMKHHTRVALAAAILGAATSLAGCGKDNSGLATGPLTTSAAVPAVRAPAPVARGGTPGAKGVDAAAWTDDGAPLTWTDADGHIYEVRFGSDPSSVQHLRDGALFAVTTDQVGGADVAVYDQGLLIQDQFITAGGPAGIRGIDSLLVRPPRREGEGAGVDLPHRMQVIPCANEINGYLIASGELIIAGAYLQRNPNLRKAQAAFAAAVGNFWLAWRALYDCEYAASWG